jgi:Serine hydrolase
LALAPFAIRDQGVRFRSISLVPARWLDGRVLHYSAVAVNPSVMPSIISCANKRAAATAIAAVLALAFEAGPAGAASVLADNWPTRPDTTVRVLLMKANQPADAVMLLPGGHGNINLDAQGHIGWGEDDFVIRSRWHYFDRSIAAIVPDVAADHKPPVSLAGFRTSPQHADDLSALSQQLRGMAPKVWIVAYDTGATSALNAVARGKTDAIAGLVLVSPVLEEPEPNSTLLIDGLKLALQRMPVLVIAHQSDPCSAPDVARIKQTAAVAKAAKFQSIAVTGGSAQLLHDPFAYAEGSCNTQTPHRLAGLDDAVTDKIIDWIHHEGETVLGDTLNTPAPATDGTRPDAPPLSQATPFYALPELSTADFRWAVLLGLNVQVVNADAVVTGQPVLRLIATPKSDRHVLAVRVTGLAKDQTYRIAAWVKPVAGGNVGLFAFDRPDDKSQPNSGFALFDLGSHQVLEASGVRERDIEQHSNAWQKVWIDLPTSDGNFLVAIRPLSGGDHQFDGDGKLGVILGGIEVKPPE